jgi:putative ATP-dependent endonuclease of the OLD family
VNHFWRLLNDLKIAHIKLLDFDRERRGGGWARIRYVIEQLVTYRNDLTLATFNMTPNQLAALGDQQPQVAVQINEWLEHLEGYNVFFSGPLDLDFLLLEAFEPEYKGATTGTGPVIPTAPQALTQRLESARSAVLKPEGGDGTTYSPAQRDLFIWYQYLFLGRGNGNLASRN